ncbi:MAG TPA: acyl-CoA dehydrogenase family protein, partial [Acidimicrobiales bacterium]|nr:acyl-CoA dehydrogenase family protein [Acidimicrobiales bacterium]
MRLAWGPEEEAFRAELSEFLDHHAPPELSDGSDFATAGARGEREGLIPPWARRWQATLFDNGWMVPGYPPELGGRNATRVQTLVYMEELAARGLPRSVHFPGYAIVAPSLLEFGTPSQRELAPAAIRGDTVWCIGMSEPNAGSDLGSLSTRAVDVPKHKGISVVILDMDTPGIDVRPLRHINGQAEFAEVFFTDVRVPKANLVGHLNDGWRITMGSLAHERGGLWVQGVATCDHALRDLIAIVTKHGLDRDPTVRRRLAAAFAKLQSLRALGYKGFSSFAQGSSAPE